MTGSTQRQVAPIALLIVVLTATAAAAQQRTWSVSGLNGDIFAVDCVDCGDDLGMTLACRGEGRGALVTVPFAALPAAAGRGPLTIDIDGTTFTYDAGTEEQGLVGFVPTFTVPSRDPLLDALGGGRSARIKFSGVETSIGQGESR